MTFSTTKCLYCGVEFRYPREFGRVKYCSGKCRVLHRPPEDVTEFKGASGRSYYSKGRKRRMARGDSIDSYVVFTYYQWMCHLCETEIDPSLVSPDLGCATLDHVLPLSQGGTHTWDNVLPAHLSCNLSKGCERQAS